MLQAPPSQEQSVPPGAIDDSEAKFIEGFNPDLPPFGSLTDDDSTHGQALAYLMRIAREMDEARQDRLRQAEINAKIYQWGVPFEPDGETAISNDIQSAVISISDIQTRDPFATFIRPVQVQDKARVFWIGPAITPDIAAKYGLPPGLGMQPVLDPFTGQPQMQPAIDPASGQPFADGTGQMATQPVMQPLGAPQELDEITGWQLRKMATAGAFPAEWLGVLDIRMLADVYQTVYDVKWADANGDDWVVENVLKTNIFGYQTAHYAFDGVTKRHVIRDVSIKQAYLDPNADGSNFDLQNCPGFEVVMDADKAKADFPQLAILIDTYAKIGHPARVDSTSRFGVASDRNFYRRTITMRVQYFRNQVVPMTPAEAIDMGLVEVGDDGQYYPSQQSGGFDASISNQSQTNPQEFLGRDASLPTSDGITSNEAGPANVHGISDHQSGVDSSDAKRPGDTGIGTTASPGSTAPAAPQWPMTYGIRQMATVALSNRICQDIRCDYEVVPILLNVCIPLPGTPFGQGLPEKLSGLQKADIVLLNAVLKYARTFANPGCAVPASVAAALQGGLKRTHIDPTETLVFPDELIRQWGQNVVMWFEPPQLPPGVPQAMNMLTERTQRTSGHSEVMTGSAPAPTSSGKLVEQLQSAAASQFGFQAKWTAKMVQRLANLMHYSHVWKMEAEDIAKIYKRVPVELLRIVVQMARAAHWDIQVDVNAGAGGTTNKKLQRALNLFAARSPTGEPVATLQTVREAADLDHEEETIKWRNEMQNAMPVPPQPQDQSQPVPGGNESAT